MVVGGIQLIGAFISTVLVDRLGRKLLMVSSAVNCALGLALFAAYDFSKHSGIDVMSYNWIPLSSVCFVIFAANLGMSLVHSNSIIIFSQSS